MQQSAPQQPPAQPPAQEPAPPPAAPKWYERWLRRFGFAALMLFLFGVVLMYHYAFNRAFYKRKFDPVTDRTKTWEYPLAWVQVGKNGMSAVVRKPGCDWWESEHYRVVFDLDSDDGSENGRVTVVEDADDDTMRLVVTNHYRKSGEVWRTDLTAHVNPAGRAASPPYHPGIWTQVDRRDLPKPIFLPRTNARDL